MKTEFFNKLADSNQGYLYCALCAILSCVLGLNLPTKWFLPILNAILIYPVYFALVSSGKLKQAFRKMMVWTVFMCLTIITFTILHPKETGAHIINGPAYRDEMLAWVYSGIGAESNPSQFIPIHLKHFALFCVLSFITAGFAALLFGSILLNYMNYYVGNLIRDSHFAWKAILMGWQIWAIVRVIGYITIAIGISHFFFVKIKKGEPNLPLMYQFLMGGLSLVLLDILLKATLAPDWQKFLQPILH